jgi:hypothetical protein
MARVKPGSRASRILAVAGDLAIRLGRGAEVAELRAAFEDACGSPAPGSFTSEVISLAERGLLERTGGRAGHTLYAPTGSGLTGIEMDDDNALLVLRALRSACRRLRRAVSTREVAQELRRLGLTLKDAKANSVRKYLETLTQSRIRGAEGFRRAMAERVHVESASAVRSAYWSIPDSKTAAAAPRSRADALRLALANTEMDLFRPTSRSEIRWYLATPAGAALVEGVLPAKRGQKRDQRRSISDDLQDLARHDRAGRWEFGRVHTVTTAYTAHGGGPPRYVLSPPAPVDQALCELEDALTALRPADEAHLISVASRRAAMANSEPLAFLADVRRDLLRALLAEATHGFPDVAHLIHRGRLAGASLRRWVDEAGDAITAHQREARIRFLEERAFNLDAVAGLLLRRRPADPPLFAHVGSAGLASYSEVDDLIHCAARHLGVRRTSAHGLVQRARRFPAEGDFAERFTSPARAPLARLDRVDVMVDLWEPFQVPRALAAIKSAHLALGHVLRDADLIASLFRLTAKPRAGDRRTLIVMLGLLGVVPELEEVCPDVEDSDDAAAWTLAVVLATAGAAERPLSLGRRIFKGQARRLVDTALMRIEGRFVFSAVG